MMLFIKLYISFFIYSVVGWIWESFLCSSIEYKRLLNRGFLLGPYCPIYGLGATLSFLVFKNISSSYLIFICAALLCCTIEYVVGYYLEKFFGEKWWDYEHYAFQIHGRVCLYGLVIFGLANVFIVKFTSPFIIFSLSYLKDSILVTIAILITILGICDLILTISALKKINPRLVKIHSRISNKTDSVLEDITNNPYIANDKVLYSGKIISSSMWKFNEKLKETEENMRYYKDNYFS
ncbi:putative ABC transporter permease [Peptoniphilus raoultii]|uniref:putative ABC transporter permease n=1 Tax=Peptoniphilus raoultii TaxID=1776387 RepID=UPI000AD8060C|nr:putative ABC transporter permease [Peptoniphilus raoultii]